MLNRKKWTVSVPCPLRESCHSCVIYYYLPRRAPCSPMMGGQSLKSSQRRSHAAEALAGDRGRGDSSAFSPGPENMVSREMGGDQGNGQAQLCFGSWMKSKRVNWNAPQRKQQVRGVFPRKGGVIFLCVKPEVMKHRHRFIL